jgi:hypothetical protein
MPARKSVATVVASLFILAALASPATAANLPLDPPAGASFNTTELPDFAVEHGPGDPPWAIVLSPGNGTRGGISFPSDSPDYHEVDIGWLAAKFNALGTFSWSICDYDAATGEPVEATCSAPRPFYITFRLSTLTAAAARYDARRVFKKLAGSPTGGKVKCRRKSRTKRTCTVGTYLGDTLTYGRVVLWNKRPRGVRTYNLTRYRATLRTYDEYCHLVREQPLSECDDPYQRRSGWTYEV